MNNTKNSKLWVSLLVLFLFPVYSIGQQAPEVDYPKVGDTIADYEFTDLDNFDGEYFRISDFRGEWLIIDFWSRFCSGCIASFPKMNTLHRQFEDRVQVLMVGLCGYKGEVDKLTKDIYYRMKSIHGLEFAVAFDAAAQSKFDVGSLPMILVINPDGVIVAKTTRVNADQIEALLNGRKPGFKRAFSEHEKIEYDWDLPLLTNGSPANGGSDTGFLFRSLLTPYNRIEMGRGRNAELHWDEIITAGKVEIIGASLEHLYLTAYFGTANWSFDGPGFGRKYSKVIDLEIADSSRFAVDKDTGKGLYAYSLTVPPDRSTEEFLKQVMQSDLRNYFGYEVSIESRPMPAYHFIVTDREKAQKLKTKGGKMTALPPGYNKFLQLDVVNKKVSEMMGRFSMCLPDGDFRFPIVDKTGIDFNVDLSIKANMLDLKSVNQALADYGIQLKKGLENMKTIVVRDIE